MKVSSGSRLAWAAWGVLVALLVPEVVRAEPSSLPPELGWNYGDQETPRTAALGGASRAIGTDLNAMFINPAAIAASRVYHLGALVQVWPQARRQSYGLAAVDSATGRLAAGISGFYTVQDSEGLRRKATDGRLALAFPLSEQLLVGVAGKYLKLRQDGLGPLGVSLASGGLSQEPIIHGFTFDAGITVRPSNFLSIGLVGANLTNPGDGFRPLGVGGGIGIGKREFSLEGDVAADFTTFQKTTLRYMVGGELLAAGSYPLRLGYRFDQFLKNHALSGGLGYIDRQFCIEASVRHSVSGDRSTGIFFGFQIFLEGMGLARSADDVDLPVAY
ncbi:MAG: hypothetical protein RMJ98_06445 [Myxococcales bacterium]|nr:hypothetical protein [Polyangiaceae bacterium]MDW8248924.1 hypothetical protein [Myxococcales bacterium]